MFRKFHTIKAALLSVLLSINVAAIADHEDDKTLIIGARPWDQNIKDVLPEFPDPSKVHFVDFYDDRPAGQQAALDTYFQLDVNNTKTFEAADFTPFAQQHRERYTTILVDIGTSHHFRRDGVVSDLHALLVPQVGRLVIPFYNYNLQLKKYSSLEKAQEFAKSLREDFFSTIETHTCETLPVEDLPGPSLYGYDRLKESEGYVFLVATKK